MLVNGIGMPSSAQQTVGQSVGKAASDLNIDDFFKLISAQLQNQSMFDTVDNAQFMSQMVQFSTLSQINALTNAFQTNMAVSMIGKQVSVSTTAEDGTKQMQVGQVEQVSFNAGVPYVCVNGEFYQMSDIQDIGPEAKAVQEE
jgi:flagellar basal-body rod modification protein FlgD